LRLSCVTYEGEEDKSSKDEQQEEKPKVVH
jgi:hypothetical protein